MVEWEVFFRHFNAASIASRKLDPDALILFICGSYGDVFANLSLIDNVVSHHNKKVVVIIDKKWSLLSQRFAFEKVTFFFVENEQQFKNALMSEGRAYIFLEGWIYPTLTTLHPHLVYIHQQGYMTIFDIFKVILQIPKEVVFKVPALSFNRQQQIKEIFLQTGCRLGKTCILSFEMNSNTPVPYDLIVQIVTVLEACKIDILLNVTSTFGNNSWAVGELAKYKKISLPQDAPIEMVEYAGAHLGPMHGLSTILANFKTDAKIGLVADCRQKLVTNMGQEKLNSRWWMLFSNLSPRDLHPSNDYSEFVLDNDSEEIFFHELRQWASSLLLPKT